MVRLKPSQMSQTLPWTSLRKEDDAIVKKNFLLVLVTRNPTLVIFTVYYQ